ncbi:TPA: hypothetical protein ACX6SG_003808 [Photobacterium damselae]
MKKLLLLFFFIFSIFIYGCGGGDGDDGNHPTPPIDHELQAPIARLRISQVDPANKDDMVVSLKKSVTDPQGLPLSLISVKSLTNGCIDPIFDQKNLTFNVTKSALNYCAYQYTVKNNSSKSQNDKESSSIGYVVMSETGKYSILQPISKFTTVGDELTIDLKSELGEIFTDNFKLQDDVYVLGSGLAVADSKNSTIRYTPDSAGVKHLLYSLHDSESNETMIGYIDIAVSSPGNSMPEAEDFLGPENVDLNTEIEIDVAPHIKDPDGDPLQLTDLYVYNDEADVALASNTDFSNTKFKFSASKAGVYDVSYVVYDHKNGFAVGIVRIKVEAPPIPWHDIILEADNEQYTAPIDLNIADLYHIYFQALDDYNLDGKNYRIPKFNYKSANVYCSSRGMVLPTKEQLIKLSESSEDKAINELDKWPKMDKFWTSDEGIENGRHLAFLFDGQLVSEDDDSSAYIVTCVVPGVLSLDVTRDDDYTTTSIDSKTCYDEITTSVLRDGRPLENVNVYLYSSDTSIFLNKSQDSTDINGQAVFQIRSTDSGEHQVSISYYSQKIKQKLNFIADTIDSYVLKPGDVNIQVNDTKHYRFYEHYASGKEILVDPNTVHFDIDKTDIATVDNTKTNPGFVTGISEGTAKLTAYPSGHKDESATAKITVNDPVTGYSLAPDKTTIGITGYNDFTFYELHAGHKVKIPAENVSWHMDKPAIAKVDNTIKNPGRVTGVAVGEAELTAYPSGHSEESATAKITVNDPVTGYSLAPNEKTIGITKYKDFTFYELHAGHKKEIPAADVSWHMDKPAIAKVDNTIKNPGRVTGVAVGEAELTAYPSGHKDEFAKAKITVNDPVTGYSLAPNEKSLDVTEYKDFTFYELYAEHKKEIPAADVSWHMDKPAIAKVDNTKSGNPGRVTGVAVGEAELTAYPSGHSSNTATAIIHVKSKPSKSIAANAELNVDGGVCTFYMPSGHPFGINTNGSVALCNGVREYTPIYGSPGFGTEFKPITQYQITSVSGAVGSMTVTGESNYTASVAYCLRTGDGSFSDSDGNTYTVSCSSFESRR